MNNYLTKIITKELTKILDEPRAYLGASSIGNGCDRAIWYGLRHPEFKKITARQRLIFETGKSIERLLLKFIVIKGCVIKPNISLVCADYPVFQGHCDAVIYDAVTFAPIAIIEIKTAKDSSFNIFKKKGLKLWDAGYYDQIQAYMGISEIPKCYVLVINKDTSELCDVLVEFDNERYIQLIQKADRIGGASIMPMRITHASPSFFKCKMCFYMEECHAI